MSYSIVFLVTSISMLRERTSGTLERLMSLPLAKADLLTGYGIAFGLLAIGNAVLGMALDLFVSAFRPHRVPGRAAHARDHLPLTAAVRAVRQPARDG